MSEPHLNSYDARYKAALRYAFGNHETAWEKEERECREFFDRIIARNKKEQK